MACLVFLLFKCNSLIFCKMTKILPFSGIIAFSTNSVDVSVETGIKISVIDVVDFVVVEEVVAT